MGNPLSQLYQGRAQPSSLAIALAFASVYIVWGSTYLAIRVTVETLPPLTTAGVRFIVAGALMYGWLRLRGNKRPTRRHWRSAAIVGVLMLLGGNGGVVWAETLVHSNTAALLVATVPLWLVLLHGLRPGGTRPNLAEIAGLVLGFVGVWVLIGPRGEAPPAGAESTAVHPLGAALLLFASFSWAIGSLYSRSAPLPASPFVATGMEMITGGVALLLGGLVAGEWARIDPSGWSLRSLLALGYLIAFGSLIGFTAYIWLLRNTTPAKAGTYAYVNPVIAVFLGWLILDEPIGPSTLGAMALILLSVLVTTRFGRRTRRPTVSEPRLEVARTKPCACAETSAD